MSTAFLLLSRPDCGGPWYMVGRGDTGLPRLISVTRRYRVQGGGGVRYIAKSLIVHFIYRKTIIL